MIAAVALLFAPPPSLSKPKYKALIIDGQSNHKIWPESSRVLKQYLEETKLFTVDIATTPLRWSQPDGRGTVVAVRRELSSGVGEGPGLHLKLPAPRLLVRNAG